MTHPIPSLVALALVAGACVSPSAAAAGEVIAHPSVTLSSAEIREVYLGEKQLAGSVKLVPVDNGGAQADFQARLLQIEGPKYTAVWTKKSFREGLSAPSVKGGDSEVIAFVKSTPGAIGYVTGSASGMKVLHKF